MTSTAFVREHGPNAYTVPLHALYGSTGAGEHRYRSLVHALLTTGLQWCWESTRTSPVHPDSAHLGLPTERPLTLLTPENTGTLAADFLERDEEDYGRFIALFGSAVDAALPADRMQLRAALTAFVAHERGTVCIVIIQIEDSSVAHVYVPHEPADALHPLLAQWGAVPTAARKKRRYAGLYLAALESLYDLPGAERYRRAGCLAGCLPALLAAWAVCVAAGAAW